MTPQDVLTYLGALVVFCTATGHLLQSFDAGRKWGDRLIAIGVDFSKLFKSSEDK